MRRLSLSIMLCIVLLFSLLVPVVAADTATLTIEPDKTQVTMDGTETKITYTITVTPPAGKEIGVFSFRLKPSGDMTLPQSFRIDGEKVISYNTPELEYDQNEGTGVFRTFEYTPDSNFFAAVGTTEENRMKTEAKILTITATIPAGSSGVYAMDAEFTVAPDGSGDSYIGKVVSSPVTVTDPNAKEPTSPGVVISDLDQPTAGEKPDKDVTVTTGGDVETETTWYCDGEKMADDAFTPGHTYTVVVHVKTNGATFDPQVYTNQGYTLNRISDTELELRRSFLVEEKFTQGLTEEEAQVQISAAEANPTESVEVTAPTLETPTSPQSDEKSPWTVPLILSGIFVAAGAALVLWKRKRH